MSEISIKNDMPPILIGLGGHGAVVKEVLRLLERPAFGYCERVAKPRFADGLLYLGSEDGKAATEALTVHPFITSIGNNGIRSAVTLKLISRGAEPYGQIIHPRATVCRSARIGSGTQVLGNALVSTGVRIGDAAIINSGTIVEHDSVVGDYCHVSPGAVLTADVVLGKGVLIGANATVIPGVKIGDWAVVGAGAVVIEDVPAGATVVGNPAIVIKTREAK